MGDVFDQVAPPQQSAPAGDVFDQVDHPAATQQPPQQAEQPGFLSRAYETSPLPGMIDAAKQSISDFVKTPDDATKALGDMYTSLRAGDFRDALHHASKLLVGQENPFQDAAKSVANTIVKDAHQSGRDMASQIPGAGAVKNYVNDLKAGNTAGAIGDVVGGASSVLPMLLGDEGVAAKAGDVVGKVSDAVADTAGKAKALVSEEAAATKAQPGVQGAVRGAAEDTAASEAVQPKQAPSVRDSVSNVADSVFERSKSTYKQLDDLSGGRWQRYSDSIKNLRDKADEVAGIDEEKFDEYTKRASDIEAAQSDLVDKLVADGKIDADTAEGAKTDYRKSQALYDLSQSVRSSASGLRPEIGEGTPETVDPAKLSARLNKLYDSGRLQQAIGEDNAGKLIQRVDEAVRIKSSGIKTAKLVKTIAKYAGWVGGASVLGETAAHILGGSSH